MVCVRLILTGLSPKPRTRPSMSADGHAAPDFPLRSRFFVRRPDRRLARSRSARDRVSPPDQADLSPRISACRRGERLVFRRALVSGLPAGGALVLTGGNGSGKSSLLRLLADAAQRRRRAGLLWGGAPVAERPCRLSRRGCTMSAIWMRIKAGADAARDAGLLGGAARRDRCARRRSTRALAAFALDRDRRLAMPLAVGRAAAAAGSGPAGRGAGAAVAARRADRRARRRRRSAARAAIAAHRAAGGRVVLATHQPIAIGAAADLRARRLCRVARPGARRTC